MKLGEYRVYNLHYHVESEVPRLSEMYFFNKNIIILDNYDIMKFKRNPKLLQNGYLSLANEITINIFVVICLS